MHNFYDTQANLTRADIQNIAYMDGPSIEEIERCNFHREDLLALAEQCFAWANKHETVYNEYNNRGNQIFALIEDIW